MSVPIVGGATSVQFSNMPSITENEKCTITVKNNANNLSTSCTAPDLVINPAPTVPGTCGTANSTNHTFTAAETSYGSYTFCSAGVVSPVSPVFPDPGNSTLWTCDSTTGGANASCSAVRLPACLPDNSCAATTCNNTTCESCGVTYTGTKNCQRSLNWREVSPN